MNKLPIEYPDLKIFAGAFLSLVTAPEISLPYVKDIMTIGVSFLTIIYSCFRIYSEMRKFKRMKKISKISKKKKEWKQD